MWIETQHHETTNKQKLVFYNTKCIHIELYSSCFGIINISLQLCAVAEGSNLFDKLQCESFTSGCRSNRNSHSSGYISTISLTSFALLAKLKLMLFMVQSCVYDLQDSDLESFLTLTVLSSLHQRFTSLYEYSFRKRMV